MIEAEKTHKKCPVSSFTDMLGGKWKLIIISRLRNRDKMRFGQSCFNSSHIKKSTNRSAKGFRKK